MSIINNIVGQTKKRELKIFFRYLKEKSIFSLFFRTLENDHDCGNYFNWKCGHDIVYFFNNCPSYDWLTNCFTWARQKEGRSFWEKKHNEWQTYLNNKLYEV